MSDVVNPKADEIYNRMGNCIEEESVFFMHPQECDVIYHHAIKLERQNSRMEWACLLLVIALFWAGWFLWSYSVNLEKADKIIQYLNTALDRWWAT